jgi:hypothetical protein
MGPRKTYKGEDVLVEDITDRPDFEREQEDADTAEAGAYAIGNKRKVQDTMDITLPYLSDAVVTVDDMLGKVPKLRYLDHDVRGATKFLDLVEESYLSNTGEMGPLVKPIMEPT